MFTSLTYLVQVLSSFNLKFYQKHRDQTFTMKQLLQYIILLETIIKEAENEYQHSCREAATKADAIRKLAA